jgi:hypothetical protein
MIVELQAAVLLMLAVTAHVMKRRRELSNERPENFFTPSREERQEAQRC